MAVSNDILLGVPYNVGGTLREVDGATPVDNVFTFSSGGKIWQRVFDGGNSVYRASWLNITGAPIDKTALVAIAVANSAIQTLEVDTTIQIDGAVDFSGKTLSVKSGGLVTGTYTISNAVIEGNLTQKILEPTGTLTTSKSATGKWHPTWFGATGDGVTDDYAAINFTVGVANTNAQKTISLLSGTYLLGSGLSVPATTVLEFENGAIIDGAVTVTGNGAFFNASIYQRVFGSSIIISGLYPQTSEISPVNFGAVRDSVTDTTAAQQRMWNYVATLTDVYTNIVYPPGGYYQASTVTLPGDMGQQRWVDISGYGVQIITDQNIVMWQRLPMNMTESAAFIDSWVATIKGFWFRGTSSISTPQISQVGIQVGAIYSWTFQDLQFYRLHNAIDAQFSLLGLFTNVRTIQCTNSSITGRYGTWAGATRTNTAFNDNKIEHSRFFQIGNAFCAIYLFGADQTTVDDVVIEGQKPQYGIYYDDDGNTGVLINTFKNIWFENTGGAVATSTNIYVRGRGVLIIQNIQRIYADYLFDISMLSSSNVIIDCIPYISNAPATGLFKVPNTQTGVTFLFKNMRVDPSGTSFVFNSANWDGAIMPTQLRCEATGKASNGGFYTRSSGSMTMESDNGTSFSSTNTSRVVVSINTTSTTGGTGGSKLFVSHMANNSLSSSLYGGMAHFFSESTTYNAVNVTNSTSTASAGPTLNLTRTKGTNPVPTIVANNDNLGRIFFNGYDGTAVVNAAFIYALVDGSVSGGIVPAKFQFYVKNSSGANVNAITIRATGALELTTISATPGTVSDSILVRNSTLGEVRALPTTTLIASGNQYQMAYYAVNGQTLSGLAAITASRALKSDANGLPVAFDTATEPSLTELSYVKGVTSPIQAQLGTKGLYATNGDGVLTVFTVTHGFSGTPTNIQVTPAGVDSAVPFFVSNITGTTFDITFTTPPIVGTNNVTFYWTAK